MSPSSDQTMMVSVVQDFVEGTDECGDWGQVVVISTLVRVSLVRE